MKQTRKVVSLVICLAMLLSMMTAMTAGAATVTLTETVFEKTFTSDADLPAAGTYFTTNLDGYCTSGNYGINDGALYAKIAYDFASGQQIFSNIKFDNFSVGKYTLTAKVKSSSAFTLQTAFYETSGFQVNNWDANGLGGESAKSFEIPAGTDEWTDITCVWNVTAVASTTSRMIFYARSNIPAGTELYFDDIKIVKEYTAERNTATVAVSGHGTVTNGNDAITNGGTVLVVPNETLTLTLTPDEGYQVGTVTVGGVATDVVNNQVSVTMDADKAINVSFVPSNARVAFYNAFDTAADINVVKRTLEFAGGVYTTVTDDTYGTVGAIKIDNRLNKAGTTQRTFDIPAASVTWEKGATYTMSYMAKSTYATTTYPLLNFQCSLTEGGSMTTPTLASQNIGTEWTEVSYTFTLHNLSADTVNGMVAWRHALPATVPATADYIYIQDIKIEKHAKNFDATVAISGNGTVANGANAVANGAVIPVEENTDLTLDITPAEGYEVAVTVDGEAVEVVDGKVSVTMDAAKAINVAFTPIRAIYYNPFDIEADTSALGNQIQNIGGTTFQTVKDATYGTIRAIRFDDRLPAAKVGSVQRTFDIPAASVTWEKGATYTMSYLAKATYETSTYPLLNFQCSVTEGGSLGTPTLASQNIGTDWTEVSYTFTLHNLSADTLNGLVAWRHTTPATVPNTTEADRVTNADYIYVQDIKIIKHPESVDATVAISGNGTVTNGEDAVAAGAVIPVEENTDLTLDITPADGYEVAVTVDGTEVEVVDGKITVTMDAAKAINVAFTPIGAIFYNPFDTSADIDGVKRALEFGGGAYATVTDATYGTVGAVKIDYRLPSDKAGTNQRTFDIPSRTWEKGATYTMSYMAKSTYATTTYPLLNFSCKLAGVDGNYGTPSLATQNIGTEWTKVSYTFTIADLPNSAETTTGVVAWRHKLPATAPAQEDPAYICIQDITIVKEETATATVSITGNGGGSVKYGANYIADGEKIAVIPGETLTLNITPNNDTTVAVTQDGEAVTDAGNNYEFLVTEDTGINVEFTEIPKATATVTITGEGTVKNGTDAVATGAELEVVVGETLTLNIVPATGYEATVTQDDAPVVSNGDNNYTFTVSADTAIVIAFTEIPEVSAGIAESVSYDISGVIDGAPTVFIFSQLNNFTTDENVAYGIKLWNAADSENKLTLNAHVVQDGQFVPAVAQPGAMFAIKVFGEAIKAENTYIAKPFVGNEEADEIKVTFE